MGLLDEKQQNALANALQGYMTSPERYRNGLANMINQESGGYGVREDGSPKGRGFLGELNYGDGSAKSTELSAESTLRNGQNLSYPLITPNQSFKDLSNLLTGGRPTDQMYDAAIQNALSRKLTGRSPFAGILEEKPYWADK